jgi:hypothetical protein
MRFLEVDSSQFQGDGPSNRRAFTYDERPAVFADPPTGAELLEQQARAAWVSLALAQSWTLWVGLSSATPVSPITLEKHLQDWATQFRRDILGSAILVGIHNDTDRLHSHALIFVPRRFANPYLPLGVSVVGTSWPEWLALWWRHGRVWAEPYDSNHLQSSTRGAAIYLAQDPGAVMPFGKAPPATRKQ